MTNNIKTIEDYLSQKVTNEDYHIIHLKHEGKNDMARKQNFFI